MLEILESMWQIAKWYIFDFVPMILTAPLGPIADLLDAIDFIYWLIGLTPIAIAALIKYLKKHF